MVRISVSIDIEAPLETVWSEAADLGSHSEWVADAESIEFETDQRQGVGTRMRVETRVGPLRTTDVMEVTEWEDSRTIGVRHQGLVTGHGKFILENAGSGTSFTWNERLTFPLYLGGPLTAVFAKPVLRWIWRRNLEGLRHRIESATGRN